jgi:DNA polymerase I-like protein with 3'-5' exonuclease and polymerase domains
MQILRETIKRTITEEEMMRLKSVEPFATFRQDSKAINFGMIFGMSFKKFSMDTLEVKWSEEKIDKFIEDKKLQSRIDYMAEKYPLVDSKLWSYYSVSEFLRNQFFESYTGLMDRIKRNEAFAKEHGYIRSFHGAIRRVPMLTFCMGNSGRTRKDEDLREISNLINITSNTSIQTDEVVKVMTSMNIWCSDKNPLKDLGFCIASVHDSLDFWVQKDVAIKVCEEIKAICEKQEDWQKGVKLSVDITIVDLTQKGHFYKHGWSFKQFKKINMKSLT